MREIADDVCGILAFLLSLLALWFLLPCIVIIPRILVA
jgi:hypothetical protein